MILWFSCVHDWLQGCFTARYFWIAIFLVQDSTICGISIFLWIRFWNESHLLDLTHFRCPLLLLSDFQSLTLSDSCLLHLISVLLLFALSLPYYAGVLLLLAFFCCALRLVSYLCVDYKHILLRFCLSHSLYTINIVIKNPQNCSHFDCAVFILTYNNRVSIDHP